MKNFKNAKWVPAIFIILVVLSSCAPGNERFVETGANFWAGLWHGFISLVSFVVSLFNEQVNIYEVNNTGWPYNLGFIIGVSIFFGGTSKSTCKYNRK